MGKLFCVDWSVCVGWWYCCVGVRWGCVCDVVVLLGCGEIFGKEDVMMMFVID